MTLNILARTAANRILIIFMLLFSAFMVIMGFSNIIDGILDREILSEDRESKTGKSKAKSGSPSNESTVGMNHNIKQEKE